MSMSYNLHHETKSSEYRDTISNAQCKCSLRPKCIIDIHETHLLKKTQMISVNKPSEFACIGAKETSLPDGLPENPI